VREKIDALEKKVNEKPSGQSGSGSAMVSLSTSVKKPTTTATTSQVKTVDDSQSSAMEVVRSVGPTQ